LDSVKSKNLIKKAVKIEKDLLKINEFSLDLTKFERFLVIGGGKATASMARELENLLNSYGKIPFSGIINIPKGLEINEEDFSKKIEFNFASHPIPDENGLKGTKRMMELVKNSSEKDLILCLISGGGSSLLPLPKEGLTLSDLKEINSLLLASGANIEEINAIRKHLSAFKGGQLVMVSNQKQKPTIISLIISDVIGNRLDTIASGPTVHDETTYEDAIHYLKKYDIFEKIPNFAREILLSGNKKIIPETPKKKDPCFDKVYNFIIGSVEDAAKAAEIKLKKSGAKVKYIQKKIEGEASEFGSVLLKYVKKLIKKARSIESKKISFIGTGELTVTIKGKGIGGRNQEMLLSFLKLLENRKIDFNFAIISVNLDGIEGNSRAMGAIVDNFSIKKFKNKNLNLSQYLENNDSNTFFKQIQDEIITGYTGINVNDLTIGIVSIT
jgi:glycerate 2-kinase